MDIKHLINHLPFYFKAKDTYKDGTGKGILEKFLEICGTYLQDNIKADIDNSLDILNINTTSSYYLNLLWDMLGQMPFARITSTKSLKLTEDQHRSLIKYTNTLLKIRGTEKFFQVMFGIFNNSNNRLAITTVSDDPGWEKDILSNTVINYPYFDTDRFDDDAIRMDQYYRMKQCINVTFNVTGNIDTTDRSSIVAFIQRFVPYFVHPVIKINGAVIEEGYTMKLFRYNRLKYRWEEAGATTTVQGDVNIKFKVEIYDSFGNVVFKDFQSWIGNSTVKTTRTSTYEFTVTGMKTTSDVYHFKMGSQEITHTISKAAVIVPVYAITTPVIESENSKITADNPSVTVKVKATKKLNGVTTVVNVINRTTGEIQTPDVNGFAHFVLTEGKTYLFSPSPSYSVSSKITIEAEAIVEDAYSVYVRRISPIPAETEWTKNSSATVSNYGNLPATFQVKLVFNHVPSVKYKGFPLTGETLSLLTEAQAKEGMSAEEFTKVQPIIKNAVATVLGIPSISISSGNNWTLPNTGAYQLIPKNGPQDEELRAVVSKMKQSVIWDVKVLDDTTEKSSKELEMTNEAPIVEATLKIKQTNNPLLTNSEKDNSLKNLSIILPDGNNITLKYGDTKIEGPTGTYKIQWLNKELGEYTVKLTTQVEGTYQFKMQVGESSTATVIVSDGKIPDNYSDEVTGILIKPVNSNGWVPATQTNLIGVKRTYQLSKDDIEAKFRILPAYVDNEGKVTIYDDDADEFGYFEMPDGTEEELGIELTFKEPGTYTFKYELEPADEDEGKNAVYSEVTLEIKDWQSTITLEVTPSTGSLQNGQASATLRISSNKPTDTLMIKELVTGDIYSNGDTFTTHKVTPEDKPFTFVPVVNGEVVETNPDGSSTKKTFKVIDPSAITVNPIILEWDADDLTPKTIKITPGDSSTEWIIVTSD